MGFYAQDQWTATDRLTLTAGLRIDVPFFLKSPTYNPRVEKDFGYNTSKVPGGNILWSPRFGFNWQATTGEFATQVRGGIGIFTGAPPYVWISNQYSNTGADYYSVYARHPNITFSPDPYNQPFNTNLPEDNETSVAITSPNFKFPQSLKFDLAVDHQLGHGLTLTVEGIYTNDINFINYKNINLVQKSVTPYGRPIYGDVKYYRGTAEGSSKYKYDNFNDVLLLYNTDKGYRYSLSVQLKKQFATGLSFDLAYTYNRAETINNGSSDVAHSNWIYNQSKDINDPRLGTAAYQRKNHILARASYAFFMGGDRRP